MPEDCSKYITAGAYRSTPKICPKCESKDCPECETGKNNKLYMFGWGTTSILLIIAIIIIIVILVRRRKAKD